MAASPGTAMIVCLRDEYVIHWFVDGRRAHTGPVVRHAFTPDAADYLGELAASLRSVLPGSLRSVLPGSLSSVLPGSPEPDARRPLHLVLALDGEIDEVSGLVASTSLWQSHDVRPIEVLERLLGPVELDLIDVEPVMARAALATADVSPDAVTAVIQLGYRMTLHLAVGRRLTEGDRSERIIEGLNHRPLPGHERLCRCGRRGCLATVLGSNSLVDRYLEAGGAAPVRVGRSVVLAAAEGDPIAQDVLEGAVTSFALALEPWLDMLGPRHLVVTGPGTAEPIGRELLADLSRALPPRHQSLPTTIVPLATAAAGVELPPH